MSLPLQVLFPCHSATVAVGKLTDARVLSRISHVVLMLHARPCWGIIAISPPEVNTPPKSSSNNSNTTIIKLIVIINVTIVIIIKGSSLSVSSQVAAYSD